MPTTLISVSGISPTIITETVWALSQEQKPVVPDEVVIITTSRGRDDLQRLLLTPSQAWEGLSVWEKLRQDIFNSSGLPPKNRKLQLSIKVIDLPDEKTGVRQEAADIRTKEHHDEAANFIIQTLGPYADAEDQHVIASIAGGRKTMGALLYAAMSLLAKESDRVTHVLVNEPYDSLREFYYPTQPESIVLKDRYGQASNHVAKEAVVELADIPFVPLRNKFSELNEPKRTFSGIIQRYKRAERPLLSPPILHLNMDLGELNILGKQISLKGRCFVLSCFLYERAQQRKSHFHDLDEASQGYEKYFHEWKQRFPSHRATSRYQNVTDAKSDISKGLNELRKKLKNANLSGVIPYLAPERTRIGFEIQIPSQVSNE